jgi:hypothetical protein
MENTSPAMTILQVFYDAGVGVYGTTPMVYYGRDLTQQSKTVDVERSQVKWQW